MFLKKSSDFDQELVNSFEQNLAANETAPEADKVKKAVALLSETCELLEEDDRFDKVCKKVTKAIKLLGKIVDNEDDTDEEGDEKVEEITSSEDAEKEVQEEIEEQQEE